MPEFNDKELKLSKGLIPAPQHWNPDTQDYEVVKGTDGATHTQLKGDGVNPDGSLNVVVRHNASSDAAVTDPTQSATLEAIAKGVLKVLQGQGTGALPATLTGGNPKGKETLSVTNGTAVGFATIPTGATRAVITTETMDVRFWVDGSTPTSTQGHFVEAGGKFVLDANTQITNFKAIAVSGTATLQVSYF